MKHKSAMRSNGITKRHGPTECHKKEIIGWYQEVSKGRSKIKE